MTKYVAVVEETRALARIVTVDEIQPIKKADFIELATIGGWQCIVKKGEFKVGSKGLFCEIDSLLPIRHPAFAFLEGRKENLKTFNDIVYSRIRTMKMKGHLSQGLLVPVPDEFNSSKVGTNLTNELGIRKLEEIILSADGFDARLNSDAEPNWFEKIVRWIAGKPARSQFGKWPSALSKSDQPRIQNVGHHYAQAVMEEELFEESFKLDGSSMTAYSLPELDEAGEYIRLGICSRNYDLSLVDIEFTWGQSIRRFLAQNLSNLGSGVSGVYRTIRYFGGEVINGNTTPWKAFVDVVTKRYFWFSPLVKIIRAEDDPFVGYALRSGLLDKLVKYNRENKTSITIQGELIGPGIQGNYEQVDEIDFYVYQVYRNGSLWVPPLEARTIVEALGLKYIPVSNDKVKLPPSAKECLKRAEGKGAFNIAVAREGVVFKSLTRDFSFKVISNGYLLAKEKAMDEEASTTQV